MIKSWKPWENSTGPNTLDGKEAAKMNAQKHGLYGAKTKELRRLLRDHGATLEDFL